uniref:Uncharacterized protein n=1 Tax=Haptolina ericina TaxID=156174 RepID=A0A7S3B0H5_9EUKA|mmetsp:Transcript_45302/g.102270  ORF Transcript_45302/g.102270 Transcript_45302/m.102270 type:complete len:103 (+) Transcript_45302:1-309(+)
MRFWAFCRGCDAETPDRCRKWEADGGTMHLKVVALAGGKMQVVATSPRAAAAYSCLGVFSPVPHAHNHQGRRVYRRTERVVAVEPSAALGFSRGRSAACAIL